MQNKNKPKKKRILLSFTLLASIFTQLTAPVAVFASQEVGDSGTEEPPAQTESLELEEEGATTDSTGDDVEPSGELPEDPPVDGEPEGDPDADEPGSEDGNEEVTDEDPVEDNDDGADDVNPDLDEKEEDATSTDGNNDSETDGEDGNSKDVENDGDETDVNDETGRGVAATSLADGDSQPLQVAQEPFELAIAHMNDTHGRVNHFPYMVTAINEFRAANENNLLLHAGDVFSGTLYFNEFLGLADLDLLNLMDIDAMVFGNHEFDLGVAGEGHEALGEFVENAEFPFVGTNIDFSADTNLAPLETNESLAQNPQDGAIYDSIVFNIDGEQVGLFGLTTEDTANIASPIDVVFSDYIATAQEAVDELEAAGIDKIIALTHIGFNSAPSVGNDVVLADNVDGIDIIVGGHSHTALEEPAVANDEDSGSPTVIVQAGENAEHLGTLNVEFNEMGEIINHSGQLLVVDPEETSYTADPTAASILAPYQEAVDAVQNEAIGAEAVEAFENPRHPDTEDLTDAEVRELPSVRAEQTPLGSLITDAMLFKAREKFPEIDFAVQNGGGIRAPIDAGSITTGEVIQVLPFGNNPVIAELTGAEIKELFELSLRNAPHENGGFLHVSGLRVDYDSLEEPGERVLKLQIVREGEELETIDLNETYLVTTNGFTGIGGDGLTPFAVANEEGRVRDIGEIDWQQLRDYMVEEQYLDGVVDPADFNPEERIVDWLGEEPPKTPEEIMNELLDRIAALEAELQNLVAQNQDQADEIAELREQVAVLTERLDDAEGDIADLEAEIARLEARVAELEEEDPDDETPGVEDPDDETPESEEPGDDSGKDKSKDDKEKPEKVKSATKKPKKETQKSLPKTGTAMSIVLPLTTGATLVLTGLGVEAYRKKNNKK